MAVSGGGVYDNICGGGGLPNGGELTPVETMNPYYFHPIFLE